MSNDQLPICMFPRRAQRIVLGLGRGNNLEGCHFMQRWNEVGPDFLVVFNQDVADELGVVHAVLSAEIAKLPIEGDGATAVRRTAVLEEKLNDTADKMAEVNEALAHQKAALEHLSKSA